MTLDFTSALYLGFTHPHGSIPPWTQLTTGKPNALAVPPAATALAAELAALIGCDDAVLAPSTLHLFWDLFGVLSTEPIAVYMDAGLYAVGRWGVERAAARGVPSFTFPHHHAGALEASVARTLAARRVPLIVTDGFCPACGRPAPLRAYLDCARRYGGQLLIDDTQALGVLGETPTPSAPYGLGGGGSLQWHDLGGEDVMIVSSLAKGFGVPIAVLAGSRTTVERFESLGASRTHCSPPSLVMYHAATRALALNRRHGDAIRRRLVGLVRSFRRHLKRFGWSPRDNPFPVQTFPLPSVAAAARLHRALWVRNVHAVPMAAGSSHRPAVALIVTAQHTLDDMRRAAACVAAALRASSVAPEHEERYAQ